ncbi:MAG: hypothetical protein GXO89_07475 [Chlorobi bacterium]|nr:hypothetical protein [Chlorobiota bacterium]
MKKQLILILSVGTIIILSFLLFSSAFYPLFNSDDGVTVLMLHYFKLPRDLYFWNQDRYGSVVPLLGQVFYKGLGISSLWSESLTHYIILVLGYLSFSSLLKSLSTKIAFAIVWFFPIVYFHHGLLRNAFGLEYSFIGMGIYLMNCYQKSIDAPLGMRTAVLALLFLIFTTAVWVADPAIITVFIIISISAYFIFRRDKSLKNLLLSFESWFLLVGGLLGILLIFYFKSIAGKFVITTYGFQINSIRESFSALHIVKEVLFDVFAFKIPDTMVSAYAYLVLILIVLAVFFRPGKNDFPDNDRKWMWVFVLDGLVLFLIVLMSHWALLNGVARRYFTGLYIVFWLAYLIYFDLSQKTMLKKIACWLILATVVLGAIGTVYSFKYVYPKRLTPKAEIVREFEQLGKIGLISEYWNSYGTSFVNPDLIKATPHDRSDVRNYDLVDSVFNQPRIYIIKDMWMDSFLDTLNQFDHTLLRKGDGFRIGGCWVCEYEKIMGKQ